MWGLGSGGIPCQLDGPARTSRQGLSRGMAEGRYFGRVFEDLGGRMGEMAYLWRVASLELKTRMLGGEDEGWRVFGF